MNAKLKRDIAIVGHAHSGKTSLVESLLFVSGTTTRKGDVMKGNSISDFSDDEIERKITINDHFLKAIYKGFQIQLIDTPGYADFIGETISALSVVDAAVLVVDCVNGVEVGTDKPDANVEKTLVSIREQLSKNAVVVDLNSSQLIETVAETDDKLLEQYLESGNLAQEGIVIALRKAVFEGKIFPVVYGSALTDNGIQDLLDAIIAYSPSPLEHPA